MNINLQLMLLKNQFAVWNFFLIVGFIDFAVLKLLQVDI